LLATVTPCRPYTIGVFKEYMALDSTRAFSM